MGPAPRSTPRSPSSVRAGHVAQEEQPWNCTGDRDHSTDQSLFQVMRSATTLKPQTNAAEAPWPAGQTSDTLESRHNSPRKNTTRTQTLR